MKHSPARFAEPHAARYLSRDSVSRDSVRAPRATGSSRFPDLALSIHPPFAPMESKPVPKLPRGTGFQFEPKWDGFRCLAFRDGDEVVLQSKAGQSLGRFFPEVVQALRALKATKFVLDGDIVVRERTSDATDPFSFDGLVQRMHPTDGGDHDVASLAETLPASLILFDLLLDARGRSLTNCTLAERRLGLEDFARLYIVPSKLLRLTPATTQRWVVDEWQSALRGHGIDGIMIKRIDQPYLSGERSAMQKLKWVRTVDCVVGGLRMGRAGVRSLLLGLFDRAGLLHHVGSCIVTSNHRAAHAESLRGVDSVAPPPPHVFSGRAPVEAPPNGSGKTNAWVPLDGSLVVEVQYDHAPARGPSFRHAAKLLRFRPDKAPTQCTTEQVETENQSGTARARS